MRLVVSLARLTVVLSVVAVYLWAAWQAAGGDEWPIVVVTVGLWVIGSLSWRPVLRS